MRAAIAHGAGSSTGLTSSPRTSELPEHQQRHPEDQRRQQPRASRRAPARASRAFSHQPPPRPASAADQRQAHRLLPSAIRAGSRVAPATARNARLAPTPARIAAPQWRRRLTKHRFISAPRRLLAAPAPLDAGAGARQLPPDAPRPAIPAAAVPGRRPAPLAAGAAARRAGAVRRRAGGDPGRGRASRLRADRHHPRDRALAPPHPLDPHPGLPPRRPAPGALGREVGLRILDPRARLRPDPRLPLLHARHAPPPRSPAALVRRRRARPTCAGCVARIRRDGAALDPRHRRRRAGREGPPLGQPQALQARAAARLPHRRADRSARAPACSRPTS